LFFLEIALAYPSARQAAQELFVSEKTVEYHLHKVFVKLGVASRAELMRIGLPRADAGD